MLRTKRALAVAGLLFAGWLLLPAPAEAGPYRYGNRGYYGGRGYNASRAYYGGRGYYNPGYVRQRAYYNPYNGRYVQRGAYYNPYTGRSAGYRSYYNPYNNTYRYGWYNR